jgi:dihydropteroate synthase
MNTELKRPLVMGILNATPDSYYDKGSYFSFQKAFDRGLAIEKEGADILDIGGESTRPWAEPVTVEEEFRRVLPLIEAFIPQLSIPISIDTRKPEVAARAVALGASLINDITGFSNPAMQEIAAGCDADCCIMHMLGTPRSMQVHPEYPDGVVAHVMRFFEERLQALINKGVASSRIILDPGIGFGKTVEQNYLLLHAIEQFKSFGVRVLIGASRKSFIQKTIGKPPENTLSATLAVHSFCLAKGADILRVHDVAEHRDIIDMLHPLQSALKKCIF